MTLYRTCSVDTLNWNVTKSVPGCLSSGSPSSTGPVSTTLQPRAKVPSWYRDLHHALLTTDTEDSVDGSDVNSDKSTSGRHRTASVELDDLPKHHQWQRAVKQRPESFEYTNNSGDYEEWRRSTLPHIDEKNGTDNGLLQLTNLSSGPDIKGDLTTRQTVPLESNRTGSRNQLDSLHHVRTVVNDEEEDSTPRMTSLTRRRAPHRDSIDEYPRNSNSYDSVPLMTSAKENSDDAHSLLPFRATPRSSSVVKQLSTGNALTRSSTMDDNEETSGGMKWKGFIANFNNSGENGRSDRTVNQLPQTLGMDRGLTTGRILRHDEVSVIRRHSAFVVGPARHCADSEDQPNKRQFRWKVAEMKALNRPVSIADRRASNSSVMFSGHLRQECSRRRASTQVTHAVGAAVSRQPDATRGGGRWSQRTSLDDVTMMTLADRDFYIRCETEPMDTESRSTLSRFASVEALYDGNRRSKLDQLNGSNNTSYSTVDKSQMTRLGEVSCLTSRKPSAVDQRRDNQMESLDRLDEIGKTGGNRRSSGYWGTGVQSISPFQTRRYSELAATPRRSSTAQFWSPVIRLASSDWSPYSSITSSGASSGRSDNVPRDCDDARPPSATLVGSKRHDNIPTSSLTATGNLQRYSTVAQRPETIGMGPLETGNKSAAGDARRLSSRIVIQIGGTEDRASMPTADKDDVISSEKTRDNDDDRVSEKIVATSGGDIRSSVRTGDSASDGSGVSDSHQPARSRSVLNVSLSGSPFFSAEKNGAVTLSANGDKLSSSMFVTLSQADRDPSLAQSSETPPKIRVLTGLSKEHPR